VSLLHAAIDALERTGAPPGFGDVDDLCIAAAAYGAPEDIQRARALLAQTARVDHTLRSTQANLALFDAHAANRAQDHHQARAHAMTAAELYREMRWSYREAQARELAGALQEARAIYERVGAGDDARRLDAQLNPVNKRGRAKGELTAREREICDLLVQGKTNRAIADQLVVSERTVESHVSSILMKMNAASRAELIAKLR